MHIRTRRIRPLSQFLLLVILLLSGATRGAAQGRHDYALAEALKTRLTEAALGPDVGVSIIDLESGTEIFGSQAHHPLNPASNMKLITAAVSLLELGADHRFRTGLYGRVEGDAVVGGLYLRGFGDPLLARDHLLEMAEELAQRGIRKVDELTVDGSFFDDQILPPAFDQQPEEAAPFRAAVAAVSVNRNAYLLRVLPGKAAGAAARIQLDAPGYFDVDNQISTVGDNRLNVIAIQRQQDDQMSLKLRGTIPAGVSGASYRRRVESPLHYAGQLMVEALRAARIQVPQRVRIAKTPSSAGLLADHTSPALSQVLYELGKYSDNFVAEMLLKHLGAEKKGAPGTSAHGVEVVIDRLRRMGLPTSKLTIVNGSGLFEGNRIAAAHFTQLLRHMTTQPMVFPEYLSQLAVGGQDGTLHRRMTTLPSSVTVRAKTGTLNAVIALGGYVLGERPGEGYAFSMLANGVTGKHHAARAMMDDIVLALAQRLEERRQKRLEASMSKDN